MQQTPEQQRDGEKLPDFDKWHDTLKRAGIQKRFWGATFENMKDSPFQKELARAKAYAENFGEYFEKGIGILFMGPVGTMKSSMSVAIAQYLIKRNKSALFIPMAELFDNLMTMSKQKDSSEFLAFENKLEHVSLLILDDLGTEYPNDWIRNKVDAIISKRYNKMLPIIITTNLKPGEIKGRYQERVYDRLKGTSLVITVAAESMRKSPTEIRN